jgi:hypothetical protein
LNTLKKRSTATKSMTKMLKFRQNMGTGSMTKQQSLEEMKLVPLSTLPKPTKLMSRKTAMEPESRAIRMLHTLRSDLWMRGD